MNTVFMLLAEYETPSIPLSAIAEKYLGMQPSTADKKAGCGDLPIPTFKMLNSQKSPRMVHVSDLAEFIDKRRKEAKIEWEKMNTPGTPMGRQKTVTQ